MWTVPYWFPTECHRLHKTRASSSHFQLQPIPCRSTWPRSTLFFFGGGGKHLIVNGCVCERTINQSGWHLTLMVGISIVVYDSPYVSLAANSQMCKRERGWSFSPSALIAVPLECLTISVYTPNSAILRGKQSVCAVCAACVVCAVCVCSDTHKQYMLNLNRYDSPYTHTHTERERESRGIPQQQKVVLVLLHPSCAIRYQTSDKYLHQWKWPKLMSFLQHLCA